MRTHTRALVPVLAAWFLAGCGIIILDEDWGAQPVREAIRASAAELNRHHAALASADALAEARAEFQRHGAAMEGHRQHLRRHVDVMICDWNGAAMMTGLMHSVETRLSSYLAEADAATTLPALREEFRA
jgi:hypothetical protein